MQNFVRSAALLLSLGLVLLLIGCSSERSLSQRSRPVRDFEVVETSTNRKLNDKEMAVLRAKVADYLDKQGATASGNYYVKVYLGPDQEGEPAEWVVVRFSRDMDLRFQLLGSDDTYYPAYQSYAAYDYYPAGYDNFSRLSFQYYDQPYYVGGIYVPPQWRDGHDRNRHRDSGHDRDKDHDGDRNHDRDHPRSGDHPRNSPPPPGTPPQVTHTRWQPDPNGQNNPPTTNQRPHRDSGPGSPSPENPRMRYQPPVNRAPDQPVSRSPAPANDAVRSAPSFEPTSRPSAPATPPPAPRAESSQGSKEPKLPAWKRDRTE